MNHQQHHKDEEMSVQTEPSCTVQRKYEAASEKVRTIANKIAETQNKYEAALNVFKILEEEINKQFQKMSVSSDENVMSTLVEASKSQEELCENEYMSKLEEIINRSSEDDDTTIICIRYNSVSIFGIHTVCDVNDKLESRSNQQFLDNSIVEIPNDILTQVMDTDFGSVVFLNED